MTGARRRRRSSSELGGEDGDSGNVCDGGKIGRSFGIGPYDTQVIFSRDLVEGKGMLLSLSAIR